MIQLTKQFFVDGKSKLVITWSHVPGAKRQFTVSGSGRRPPVTRDYDGFTTQKAYRDHALRAYCVVDGTEMTGNVLNFVRNNIPAGWVS
ncbi:MAG: hypothetical protein RLY57_632 [Candidatus Parcubacteria bacterium]|jgi:hypothetical protein